MKSIAVIGAGRLGICACLSFEAAGYNVLACDINAEYVNKVTLYQQIKISTKFVLSFLL